MVRKSIHTSYHGLLASNASEIIVNRHDATLAHGEGLGDMTDVDRVGHAGSRPR